MPWIKVDDHYDEHPKFAAAGPLGHALWLAGLAYCNRNLTDGFIPWAVARSLLTWEFLEPEDDNGGRRIVTISVTSGMSGDDVVCEYVIELLLAAGLWTECPGGYRVHDYGDYQPTRAQVESERAQKAAAGAAGGKAAAKARATAAARARAAASGLAESKPVPVPVPVGSLGSTSATHSGPRARDLVAVDAREGA